MKIRIQLLLFGLVVAAASPLMAQLTVALSPNVGSPQPIGSSITWTATVSGDPDPNPSYEYQFTGQPVGFAPQVRRGYGHSKTFTLTPSAFETTFNVGVTVKNVHAGTWPRRAPLSRSLRVWSADMPRYIRPIIRW